MTQQTLRAVFAASVLVLAPTFTATAQATLTGVVRDSAGRPLVRAEIAIEARRKSTTTDENGRYRLTDVPTGSSLVQARAIGYQAVASLVTLAANETKLSDFTLNRLPPTLDTVKVKDNRTRGSGLAGFDERRRLGMGKFFDSLDLKKFEDRQLVDVFREVPGVRITTAPMCLGNNSQPGCESNMRKRVIVNLRGGNSGCPMAIVLDGTTLYRAESGGGYIDWPRTIDVNDLPVAHLVALEVYRSAAEIPIEYGGPSAICGVMVMWTKRS
jgi:hypothetical protein